MPNDDTGTGLSEDERLQRRVLEELEWEPAVDAARIGVTARDGAVTLSGKVSSHAERAAARGAAERVAGVRAVAVDVEVEIPGAKRRSDADIAERAVRILRWSEFVPDDRILVEVERGWVTLRGEVEHQFERTAAEAAVGHLSGVRGITNAIALEPHVASEDVRQRIEKAFLRSADLEAAAVLVDVAGDTVALSGRVRSLRERNIALAAAWAAPGVRRVEDGLRIEQ